MEIEEASERLSAVFIAMNTGGDMFLETLDTIVYTRVESGEITEAQGAAEKERLHLATQALFKSLEKNLFKLAASAKRGLRPLE
jgi:hypothetical protein